MLSMDYHHVAKKLKFAYQKPKQKPNNRVATDASEEQVVYHFAILLEIESREFFQSVLLQKTVRIATTVSNFF